MATSTKTKSVVDEPEETAEKALAVEVEVGTPVTVFVHPVYNRGEFKAHGVVTRVLPDDAGQVYADVHVLGPMNTVVDGVLIVADAKAAQQLIDQHFELLPGHSRDDTGRLIPGRNPRNGRGWERHDVLHWVAVAYPAG